QRPDAPSRMSSCPGAPHDGHGNSPTLLLASFPMAVYSTWRRRLRRDGRGASAGALRGGGGARPRRFSRLRSSSNSIKASPSLLRLFMGTSVVVASTPRDGTTWL